MFGNFFFISKKFVFRFWRLLPSPPCSRWWLTCHWHTHRPEHKILSSCNWLRISIESKKASANDRREKFNVFLFVFNLLTIFKPERNEQLFFLVFFTFANIRSVLYDFHACVDPILKWAQVFYIRSFPFQRNMSTRSRRFRHVHLLSILRFRLRKNCVFAEMNGLRLSAQCPFSHFYRRSMTMDYFFPNCAAGWGDLNMKIGPKNVKENATQS